MHTSTNTGPAGFIAHQVEVVWLSGADRLPFLERMSTARLADLARGSGRATVVLTDTGRVVDLVACHAAPAGAALVTSGPGAAAVVAAQLMRYVLFGDEIRATDASTQVTVLRVLGPSAQALASAASGIGLVDSLPGAFVEAGSGDATVWLLRHPVPGGLGGVDIVVPAGAPARAMAARLLAAGAATLDPTAYSLARVRAGLPAYGAEFGSADLQANPLELNLKAVVDFAKGCYIGQEVVARLESYDRVQRRLVRLRSPNPLEVGNPVLAPVAGPAAARRGKPGRVTTAAADAGGTWLALALVPVAWFENGELAPVLEVETAAGTVTTAVERSPDEPAWKLGLDSGAEVPV